MTGYLTKLKDEMEGRLGCGIEVVEDRDLRCLYKKAYESALRMFESHRGR